MTIDFWSGGTYPANVLSNFNPNAFVFDGVQCSSYRIGRGLELRHIEKAIKILLKAE